MCQLTLCIFESQSVLSKRTGLLYGSTASCRSIQCCTYGSAKFLNHNEKIIKSCNTAWNTALIIDCRTVNCTDRFVVVKTMNHPDFHFAHKSTSSMNSECQCAMLRCTGQQTITQNLPQIITTVYDKWHQLSPNPHHQRYLFVTNYKNDPHVFSPIIITSYSYHNKAVFKHITVRISTKIRMSLLKARTKITPCSLCSDQKL